MICNCFRLISFLLFGRKAKQKDEGWEVWVLAFLTGTEGLFSQEGVFGDQGLPSIALFAFQLE